jgi:hypothetical protein
LGLVLGWPQQRRQDDRDRAQSDPADTPAVLGQAVKPWEQVAMSIIESLIDGDLSADLARAWLKMILDYAEALE